MRISRVEPGDLIDVNCRLREILSTSDNAAYALHGSFAALGEELEDAAAKARRALELTSSRIFQLLNLIEQHPAYLKAKGDTHDQNKP